ncbi:hypothetical protein SI65_04693 [Aspergillus cristatus]|uniref:Uncharacterized protein n=1 Tax=Aspergillus cristatus TaxID=573508 RepID=A0A1E3BFK8_ASPCR|nr:hypothetical protein SI65_04693 [Aspergillus cristatus]
MSAYNDYQVKGHYELPDDNAAVQFTEEQLGQMAWFSLIGAIWQTGYLLDRYTFTSSPEIHLPIGPMGYKTSHWNGYDTDLSQAVLVTQARDVIQDIASPHAHISSEVFDYSQMDSAVELMSGFNLRKVVIVDFGGRDGALDKFVGLMQKKEKLQGVVPVVIYVGQEQKISSDERKPRPRTCRKPFQSSATPQTFETRSSRK